MARPSARRPALARTTVAAVVLVALLAAPATRASAALAPFYPTQSGGDRGTDVVAIQLLFRAAQGGASRVNTRGVVTGARNPIVLEVSGVFDPATTLADQGVPVVPWPRPDRRRRPADLGRARRPAGSGLGRRRGHRAPARAAREAQVRRRPLDGVYGAVTAADVTAFQAPHGPAADGSCERRDVADARLALRGAGLLGVGAVRLRPAGTRNWGTAETVATIAGCRRDDGQRPATARSRSATSQLEHGGDIPSTTRTRSGSTPTSGRCARRTTSAPTVRTGASRPTTGSATRALIMAIQAATPGHVKMHPLQRPAADREGLTRSTRTATTTISTSTSARRTTRIATTAAEASPPRGRSADYLIVRVPVIAPGWMVQKNV